MCNKLEVFYQLIFDKFDILITTVLKIKKGNIKTFFFVRFFEYENKQMKIRIL